MIYASNFEVTFASTFFTDRVCGIRLGRFVGNSCDQKVNYHAQIFKVRP